jgi:hypothetical protein
MSTDIDTIYIGGEWVTPSTTNVPQPARLLIPIIAPRAFSRHARRVYGTSTPPKTTA